MSDNLRIGMAGTGRMAEAMLRTVAVTPGVEISAVASGDRARARRFADAHGIAGAEGDVAALVARADVDALYVANRSGGHAAAAMASIEARKPVLVEKPLAIALEEGEALVAAARAADVLLVENIWTLALPAYREALSLVRAGSYGQPVRLSYDFGYPSSRAAHPSLFDPHDGGVLRDRAVYGVSFARAAMGPITAVSAACRHDEAGTDVVAALRLEHAGGGLSQLGFALNALMPNRASVACTDGLIQIEPPVIGAEAFSALAHPTPQAAPDGDTASPSARDRVVARLKRLGPLRLLNRVLKGGQVRRAGFGADPYLPMLAHWRELVAAGRAESDVVPLDLSLDTLRAVSAAHTQAQAERT